LVERALVVELVKNAMQCPLHTARPWKAGSGQQVVKRPPAMPRFDRVKDEFSAILCADGSSHACYLSAMPQTTSCGSNERVAVLPATGL
jgi:hypothetical protein